MNEDLDVLYGWTIYWHPSDFPQHFAVRMWWIPEAGVVTMHPTACLCLSLDEAREQVPAGAIRLAREEGDDPVIVETYL